MKALVDRVIEAHQLDKNRDGGIQAQSRQPRSLRMLGVGSECVGRDVVGHCGIHEVHLVLRHIAPNTLASRLPAHGVLTCHAGNPT